MTKVAGGREALPAWAVGVMRKTKIMGFRQRYKLSDKADMDLAEYSA